MAARTRSRALRLPSGVRPHGHRKTRNLRDDGTNLYDYDYDYRNQLVRVRQKSSGATIATYDYDGRGRRIAKTVSGSTTSFYWIGLQLAMEYDASGLSSRRHYGVGFGTTVSAYQRDLADLDQDSSTSDYVSLTPLYDGSYDCVGVLGHLGAIAESYTCTYDGSVVITGATGQTISASAVGWHQAYGQMYHDTETNFDYAVHRYYASALGRWTTVDPLGPWHDDVNKGNGFACLGNKYRNAWDPLGLEEERCCGKRYVLFIVDPEPFTSAKAKGSGNFYNAFRAPKDNVTIQETISDLKKKVSKAGYEHKTANPYDKVKEQMTDEEEAQAAKQWKKELQKKHLKDPCLSAVVLIGHGGETGGFMIGFTKDSALVPEDVERPNGLLHELEWMFLGYCYAGHDKPGYETATGAKTIGGNDSKKTASAGEIKEKAGEFKPPPPPK